ncbi:hypothetical protein BP5796_04049 [Coleophoma crateriformis]|uniref:DDHD domain-containing protein n=1 Tax=Coleophoma crateriformis TaxID=565419 RepID=A0A3D8SHT5_9HELO|nr:hypothetical protein BP5796_04049 [Coleophoma crateriformis]
MPSSTHTYGPTCLLAQSVFKAGSRRGDDDIPDLKAQFFYTSALPIDDPLSAAPSPAGSDTTRHPPRPFSAYDNNTLEEAWLSLASEKDRKHHFKGKPPMWATKDDTERRASILKRLAAKSGKKSTQGDDIMSTIPQSPLQAPVLEGEAVPDMENLGKALESSSKTESVHKNKKTKDDGEGAVESAEETGKSGKEKGHEAPEKASNEPSCTDKDHGVHPQHCTCCGQNPDADGQACCKCAEQRTNTGDQQDGASDSKPTPSSKPTPNLNASKEHRALEKHQSHKGHKEHEKHHHHTQSKGHKEFERHALHDQALQSGELADAGPSRALPSGPAGITGSPFARVPSRRSSPLMQSALPDSDEPNGEADQNQAKIHVSGHVTELSEETVEVPGCRAHKNFKEKDDLEVPVGISRLHLVKLPSLQLKPIYWSPVHDQAAVTRGTWFYRDSMYPVEPAVANQLEIGYRELRPWSQTWKDELSSALEVGAAGEEKLAHRLWPKEADQEHSRKTDDQDAKRGPSESILSTDPYCAARCFNGEAAATGSLDDEKASDKTTIVKRYLNSQVIFKDGDNAFILKPSMVPSAYYSRKPVTKIMKGHTVGIHVVRGFNWKFWDKLHPSKKGATVAKAEENAPVASNAAATKDTACAACRSHEERPQVTDLVLVIHGIGQKLSERVESFHFTHAINAFRRSVNVELGSEAVQPVLRKGLGGVMVLPVNWRSNLSFEEGGPKKGHAENKESVDPEAFTLNDITPETIPAVRSLISDVMLDIPFYMSHHKPKMIEALITEANRVYTLWCKNNPEFHDAGRVHLIAHSLGSVMALDVLSKQPTYAPKTSPGKKINTKHFDFDTSNLFFVGSPAGFFLLLEKGELTPRRGRAKPGADFEDIHSGSVTGLPGTFGSLAVDNVYNVMHYNDPIAYRVNATVDPLYAASLKNAQVPSATTGFFESIGNAIKSITPGVTAPTELAVGQLTKPPPFQRLPSQLEMDVHDFTREEIAEKKFHLLNDNGQVDWFLSSGGGPLEIQYLNMLGAHSSYWGSPDFVRMLVTEVGREPGKRNTLPNLRAVKVGHRKRK